METKLGAKRNNNDGSLDGEAEFSPDEMVDNEDVYNDRVDRVYRVCFSNPLDEDEEDDDVEGEFSEDEIIE